MPFYCLLASANCFCLTRNSIACCSKNKNLGIQFGCTLAPPQPVILCLPLRQPKKMTRAQVLAEEFRGREREGPAVSPINFFGANICAAQIFPALFEQRRAQACPAAAARRLWTKRTTSTTLKWSNFSRVMAARGAKSFERVCLNVVWRVGDGVVAIWVDCLRII